MDLLRTYRMYQKMMHYPKLLNRMREIFVGALSDRGIVSPEGIEQEAKDRLQQANKASNKKDLREYRDILIDLYFANHFSDEEIDDHINLARKLDRFKVLNRVVNMEGATAIKIKRALKDFCEIPQGDLFLAPNEAIGSRVALINHFVSNQLPFISTAKNHITIRDIDEMMDQMYWNKRRPGRIGGKAAGMVLAYKIINPRLTYRDPELERYVVIPESYYFNGGIFSDFLDYNELHGFHSQKYKSRETIEEEYKTIGRLFERASFPPDMVEAFRDFLTKVGEAPLILRSSSLLEDNFGYAFSGKYDSVFLANQGDFETRLKEFIWGLKRVHMSTFGPAPMMYRRDNDLLDFDEKMSVLVQKVAGRRFGDYFFPFAAGVAYSFNTYGWTPRIKKEDGLVRLVFGLGTRAVDTGTNDYPRMIALSHATLRPEAGTAEIMKYSQKRVDVLNLKSGQLEAIPYVDLLQQIEYPDLRAAISINKEGHLASPMFKAEAVDLKMTCLSFDNFLTKSPFLGIMKRVLRKLEEAYGRPVDIEFAWDDGKLYLLQCRTLAIQKDTIRVTVPKDIPDDQVLFTNNHCISNGMVRGIEYIVYVDPKAYARLGSYEERIAVGRAVSKLNRCLEDKRYALFGPGRWGSNDIDLGVRVGYEDINHTLILGEIAFEAGGYTPEVSHGTHFFNDLVEAKIIPVAIYPDAHDTAFREDFLLTKQNLIASFLPEYSHLASVVHVIHVPSSTDGRYLNVYQDGKDHRGIAFFVGPEEAEQESAA